MAVVLFVLVAVVVVSVSRIRNIIIHSLIIDRYTVIILNFTIFRIIVGSRVRMGSVRITSMITIIRSYRIISVVVVVVIVMICSVVVVVVRRCRLINIIIRCRRTCIGSIMVISILSSRIGDSSNSCSCIRSSISRSISRSSIVVIVSFVLLVL